MMEDTWLSIDDYDSSNHSLSDSDAIDSETEAELYSVIHYEENLINLNNHTFETDNVQTSQIPVPTSDNMNISCTEKSKEQIVTESVSSLRPVSQNDGDNYTIKKNIANETIFLNKLAQKLNPLRKEKSYVDNKVSSVSSQDNIEDSGFNQTLKNTSLSNTRKRKTDESSSKSSNSTKKNCTGLIDSSDSDSIIWTDVDTPIKKEFQTNLSKDEDLIYLSSGSESESNCLSSVKKSEAFLKNLSMPNIKIGEDLKDIWFINDKDLHRSKKNLRRYHDNVENTCTNCFRKGHNSRICPVPKTIKCFICGGGHPISLCGNRICGKCFNTGHDSMRCWMPCISYCTLCNMRGHIKENCPDIWRRYHLTTHPGNIVRAKKLKQNKLPYCWNCGQGGHFGAVCQEFRGPKYRFPTWPCVVSYDEPENILRNRLKGFSDRRGSFRREARLNQRNVANEGRTFITEKKTKKKKHKLKLQQCNSINTAPREKDFPRTPKGNTHSNLSDDAYSNLPESLNQMITKRQKRKERNRRRRLKKQQRYLARINASENSLQTET